jgi:hypothetical protein
MRAKSLARLDAIFINHSQRAKAHHLGVVVVSKRKRVFRLKPTVVSRAATV